MSLNKIFFSYSRPILDTELTIKEQELFFLDLLKLIFEKKSLEKYLIFDFFKLDKMDLYKKK